MTTDKFPITLTSPVILAPMSGITDLPFRQAVARFGAGMVVSEMISSGEMVTARPSRRAASRARAEIGDGVPTSVQIAGREAGSMAEAARIAEGQGAPVIDINMGCPAKKVVGGLSGSALMRDLDLALTLIDAVINAVRVPVTLKMRLGWDFDCLNAPLLAQRAEAAGIAMFTVHGRTRSQFYTGQADWHAIRSVVDAVSVPVIANGDIRDAKTARRALAQSNAAGVMIGRGAQGRPWALAEIAAELYGLTPPEIPHGAALADQVCDHYESILSFYGKDLGVRIARKHLGWYVDAAGGSVALRSRLMREKDPATVLAILPDALTRQKEAA
ncbi:tRNA dihydrouridine synthase DusB [Pararhodobacter sp.]|uniref:tRNA dihydrouridine synthase DusB n=1 Tax=Pararhodobacter sp. TaxID=2127056 RepID=UPI002AFE8ACC|nr:tRNA dihydrouridine synthase DusB [Pararhodobacter sp.]